MLKYFMLLVSLLIQQAAFAQDTTRSQQNSNATNYHVDGTISNQSALEPAPKEYTRNFVITTRAALWSPTVKLEGRANKLITVGLNAKLKLIFFTGIRVEPFVRFYPKKHAPSGFFVQVKGIYGWYHTRILGETRFWNYESDGAELPNTSFNAFGAGAMVGYQWLVGHDRHGVLEVFGGAQYVYYNLDISNDFIVQKLAVMMPLDIGFRLGGAF